jgi:hypothetical protein
VSDAWNEDEWVAAFLDGRVDERERADMLARLTTDDEAYEHFAATAAILREAEATEDADAGAAAHEDRRDRGVVPLHPGKPATAVRWLALAAGIAALALAGPALWPRVSSAADPVRLAARLERVERGLPAGWNQPPPWSAPRGDGVPDHPSAEEKAARAARAGALLVDLSVAVRGRDAARTRLLAEQVTQRFDPQARRNGALRRFEEGAGGPPERLEPLVAKAADRVAAKLGREALERGAWTEAARLAADRQDAGFFRDRGTGPMLDRLAATDPPARAAVQRVRRLLAEADPPPWNALADALRALSRAIASG